MPKRTRARTQLPPDTYVGGDALRGRPAPTKKPPQSAQHRKQLFAAHYVKSLNATVAAVAAGYSERTGRQQGARLLSDVYVQQLIHAGTKKALASAELSAARTLEQIRRGMEFDVRKLFDAQGNLRPVHELGDEEAAAIAGLEVVKRNLTSGDGQQDVIIKVKLAQRGQYVELAAKHFALLTEKVQLTDEAANLAALQAGRARVAAARAKSAQL